MSLPCPIDVGTAIEMPFMGDDVEIVVQSIPEDQPYVDTDGFWLVVDQYGEEHMTQLDGDTWVTAKVDELGEAGTEIWLERQDSRRSSLASPSP